MKCLIFAYQNLILWNKIHLLTGVEVNMVILDPKTKMLPEAAGRRWPYQARIQEFTLVGAPWIGEGSGERIVAREN